MRPIGAETLEVILRVPVRRESEGNALSELDLKQLVRKHDNFEDINRGRHFAVLHRLFGNVVTRRVDLEERLEVRGRDALQLDRLFHSSISKSCDALSRSFVRRRHATVTRFTNLSDGFALLSKHMKCT